MASGNMFFWLFICPFVGLSVSFLISQEHVEAVPAQSNLVP